MGLGLTQPCWLRPVVPSWVLGYSLGPAGQGRHGGWLLEERICSPGKIKAIAGTWLVPPLWGWSQKAEVRLERLTVAEEA